MWAFNRKDPGHDFLVKLMILGDSTVGKSQLFQRILRKPFSHRYAPTVGIDFGTLTLKIATGRILKAQIVDTSGLDSYRSITQQYWSLASGAIIVYDITSRDSFNRVRTWVRDFKSKHVNKTVEPVIMIVGNKSDAKAQREVPTPEAQAYALAQGFLFMETSAADNHNVELAFTVLLTDVYYATVGSKAKERAEVNVTSQWKPQARTSSLLNVDRLMSPLASPTRPDLTPRHKSFDERLFAMFKWIGGDSDNDTPAHESIQIDNEKRGQQSPPVPVVNGRPSPQAESPAMVPEAAEGSDTSPSSHRSHELRTEARMGRHGSNGYDPGSPLAEINTESIGRLGRSKTTVPRR
ncbi:P-loop containing nucleoside triphosphate hydrolase protein [Powellomyces hirtus]|nr:P-loop containing nucleoside triphosphate hydrolase protein [Powellomyces hirtus]